MRFDKDCWKELDINTDSLWLIGPRAKGGKRCNVYHGNFVPQIPEQMIRRYTEENDTILDMFMGSGTTLFECETLHRNFIGIDINPDIITFVMEQMKNNNGIKFYIHNTDVTNQAEVQKNIESDLKDLGKKSIDHIIIHPPYLDIVKFTNNPRDLSNICDINEFIDKFKTALINCVKYLKTNKYISVVIGDIYRNGEVIPLGFYVMQAIKDTINCKLKGIVVKDIVGNRAKLGSENLWRYRVLKSDNFIFKHEYIFVFKKLNSTTK